jgi:hypothetical protein
MFRRNETPRRGRPLRATRGVPGFGDLILLGIALLLIVLPPFLSDALAAGAAKADLASRPLRVVATAHPACPMHALAQKD